MYKPSQVLTSSGLKEYEFWLRSIKKGIDFMFNNADDLHLGANSDEDQRALNLLIAMNDLLSRNLLLTGDGESYPEEE